MKITITLFAIGTLLSWNSMLSSMDLYVELIPSYKPTFTLIIPLSLAMATTQALILFCLPPWKPASYHIRVTLMFGCSTIIIFAIALVSFLGP